MLLLWPDEVRRKREGDFGQIGPALLAGTNNCPSFINKISSTSYSLRLFCRVQKSLVELCLINLWQPKLDEQSNQGHNIQNSFN